MLFNRKDDFCSSEPVQRLIKIVTPTDIKLKFWTDNENGECDPLKISDTLEMSSVRDKVLKFTGIRIMDVWSKILSPLENGRDCVFMKVAKLCSEFSNLPTERLGERDGLFKHMQTVSSDLLRDCEDQDELLKQHKQFLEQRL